MLTGLHITLDGTLETVTLDNTTTGSLVEEIQQAIGCDTFDVVALDHQISLYVDDEGIYRSSLNPVLSLAAAQLGGHAGLFGAGVFLGLDEGSGDARSLTQSQAHYIVRACLAGIIALTGFGGNAPQ